MPGHPILIRRTRARRPSSFVSAAAVVLVPPYVEVALLDPDDRLDPVASLPVEAPVVPVADVVESLVRDDPDRRDREDEDDERQEEVPVDDVEEPFDSVVPVEPADEDAVVDVEVDDEDDEEESDQTSCEGSPLIRLAT